MQHVTSGNVVAAIVILINESDESHRQIYLRRPSFSLDRYEALSDAVREFIDERVFRLLGSKYPPAKPGGLPLYAR